MKQILRDIRHFTTSTEIFKNILLEQINRFGRKDA